jgi:hypothetical protein
MRIILRGREAALPATENALEVFLEKLKKAVADP